MAIKNVCAWCGVELEQAGEDMSSAESVSHGICGVCANRMFGQMGAKLHAFLDRLDAPIVVIDEDGIVKSCNSKACALLDKELSQIEGFLPGEVFRCIHSMLPAGCGGSIHCSGCALRRTISETYATGKSFTRVPAFLKPVVPGETEEISMLISTEKVGDCVMLRIDRLGEQAG